MGKTSTWEGIAVAGNAGQESVFLVNGSGEFLSGTKTQEGGMDWGTVVKPGGGSSASGIDFLDPTTGYVCDTNAKVYETTDGGKTWTTIGIDGGTINLLDVAAVDRQTINTCGGGGTIYRYNGAVWTPNKLSQKTIHSIDRNGSDGLAAGSGGFVYRRGDSGWSKVETSTTNILHGVSLDSSGGYPDVAVGANGTVIERGKYTAEPPNRRTTPSKTVPTGGKSSRRPGKVCTTPYCRAKVRMRSETAVPSSPDAATVGKSSSTTGRPSNPTPCGVQGCRTTAGTSGSRAEVASSANTTWWTNS